MTVVNIPTNSNTKKSDTIRTWGQYRFMSGKTTEPLESLGDSITTAVLLSWSKEPGDGVKEDDVIAVVETDKVTMDIRAKKSGVFVEALAESGAEVTVGNNLYVIDTSVQEMPVSSETTGDKPEPAKPAAPADPVTVPVPIMGESITQGNLAAWLVKSGDYVGADEVVASIETDKVTVEVRSPHGGFIAETFAGEGDEVEVDAPLFSIVPGEAPAGSAAPAPAPPAAASAAAPASTPAPSPSPAPAKAPAPAPSPAPTPTATAPGAADRSETRVKMTRMRMRISQRLKEAQNTAAMLTTFQEVSTFDLNAPSRILELQ
jgi:2-oxoglutarate dehydrogenase E2 component (dihydrolipoamide succinyltransferase)